MLIPNVVALLLAVGQPGDVSCRPPLECQQIIVDFKDDTPNFNVAMVEGFLTDLKLNSIHSEKAKYYIAEVNATDVERVLTDLRSNPFVENAELVVQYSIPENEYVIRETADDKKPDAPPPGSVTPDDPLYHRQWSFQMIDLEKAWEKTQGEGAVIVAVIDTGVAFEDFQDFRKIEDLEGVKFAPGYDFVNDDEHPNDDHGHGSHVAGTIAQATNNAKGVAGIAPGVTIMPLKVLSAQGGGSSSDISDAIRFAADHGAKIINMSLGGGSYSAVMATAVKYAHDKGVLVACAAGNSAREVVEFPAAYDGAFAVSSVGPSGKLAYYSSFGKQIKIAAPGGDKHDGGERGSILQNTIDIKDPTNLAFYGAFQGTSMATPHVAGVAALVLSYTDLSVKDLEKKLIDSATEAGATGWDPKYGHGILNADAALSDMGSYSWGSFFYEQWSSIVFFALAILSFLIGMGFDGYGEQKQQNWCLSYAGTFGAFVILRVLVGYSLIGGAFSMSVIPAFVISLFLLGVVWLRPILRGLARGCGLYMLFGVLTMSAGPLWFSWVGLNIGLCFIWSWVLGRLTDVKRF